MVLAEECVKCYLKRKSEFSALLSFFFWMCLMWFSEQNSIPPYYRSYKLYLFCIQFALGWCTWHWCEIASYWWTSNCHETGHACQGDNRDLKRERSWAVLSCSLWSWGTWSCGWSHPSVCWSTGACGAHCCLNHGWDKEKSQVISEVFLFSFWYINQLTNILHTVISALFSVCCL